MGEEGRKNAENRGLGDGAAARRGERTAADEIGGTDRHSQGAALRAGDRTDPARSGPEPGETPAARRGRADAHREKEPADAPAACGAAACGADRGGADRAAAAGRLDADRAHRHGGRGEGRAAEGGDGAPARGARHKARRVFPRRGQGRRGGRGAAQLFRPDLCGAAAAGAGDGAVRRAGDAAARDLRPPCSAPTWWRKRAGWSRAW